MLQARPVFRVAAGVVAVLLVFAAGWLAGGVGLGRTVDRAALTDLERQFTDRMHGIALVGRFTIDGREDRPASPDRYDISSVEKIGGNAWRFNARLRYGSVDTTLPIVVTMLWVGDTPMITITDLTVPAMGTFTARVFFYGDRYAGTWQHGKVGGHMFGRIEKTGAS